MEREISSRRRFFLVLVQMNLTSKYKSFITSYLIYSLFLCFFMFSNQTQGHHRSTRYYRHPHIRPRFHMRPHRHASRKKKTFHSQIKNQQKKISRFTGEICLSRQIFLEMIFFPRSRLCGGSFLQKE